MLDEGVIRRSCSQWSSPLHMVKKKDGSWRPCGDYCRLNLQTVEDKYLLPNMADLVARLSGSSVFSKLDLKKGYLQVPVTAADVAKTAIITPFGLFEFVRMPFGLKNAGMTFQRLMDLLLGNLPFAFVYLDDILVASPSEALHRRHLCQVFSLLEQNGLVVNSEKCVFGQASIEFLGHLISAAGSNPLPSRVGAIAAFPRPATVRQLQAFLGLFNFYRKFIPATARVVLPLTRALRGGPRGDQPLDWSVEMAAAFDATRQSLSSTAVLEHPIPEADLSLVTDASATHVGAAIQQRRPGQGWRPLGFFSAQLTRPKLITAPSIGSSSLWWRRLNIFAICLKGDLLRYSPTTGRWPGLSHSGRTPRRVASSGTCLLSPNFRPPFITSPASPMWWRTLFPDRLPTFPWQQPSPNQRGSTLSLPLVAAGYRAEVNAPSGSSAPLLAAKSVQVPSVAASSPPPASPVDLAALAAAQPTCPDCRRAPFSSLLRVTTIQMDNTSIMVDTSSGVFRPLVPAAFHRPIFDVIHGLAHPGIRATRRLIASHFVWPGLASQVAAWCRDCQHCQCAKVVAQPSSPPQSIANPVQQFSHLRLDLVGPLPQSSEGYTHLLTVVDRSTRWAEAVPLCSTAADSCATALIGGWIARFGVPQRITSDRGPQFTSAVWSALTSKLGIKSQLTSPYHPQLNRAVERFHRRLTDALRARLAGSDWPAHLPWVLLGLRVAPREDSGFSAAKLVYGCALSLPSQFLLGAELPPTDFVRQLNS
jgi:hypothetical protein